MSVFIALLATIGVGDLCRPHAHMSSKPRRVLAFIAAMVALSVLGSGVGIAAGWAIAIIAVTMMWLLTTPHSPHSWPVVILGLFSALALIFADHEINGPMAQWFIQWRPSSLAAYSVEQFALIIATSVFLIGSANIIVRMLLTSADPAMLGIETTLKGGRFIGPLERLFIFLMAVGGQYLAVSAVIAAKSILRFPEISGDEPPTKAEYVLVGSFLSWGLALVCIPLL